MLKKENAVVKKKDTKGTSKRPVLLTKTEGKAKQKALKRAVKVSDAKETTKKSTDAKKTAV